MNQYVLDNAVTTAWRFSDEATSYTENLLDRLSNLVDSAVAPALWLYEVTNVTMLAVRKRRITKVKAIAFLKNLTDLPIKVEPTIRRDLPLATLDAALIEARKTLGKGLV